MKCHKCTAAGVKSFVSELSGRTTCAGFMPFYDTMGVYHSHNPNITTTEYICSEGHRWSDSHKSRCPVEDCDWNEPQLATKGTDMDTAFAKVVRTANGPAILIDGYVIGVNPPPELGHEICVDAIVSGLRGQATVVGGPEPIYARLTPEMLPSLDHLGGFTLHPVETEA